MTTKPEADHSHDLKQANYEVMTNPIATKPRVPGAGGRFSRHLVLLKNDDIERWFRNMRSGSEKTAKVWLAAVGRFLEWSKRTPEALLGLSGDAATRLLEDYRDEFQTQNSGTHLTIKAVRSLLARKGIALTQRIKVQRKDSTHEQHIPTQAELRKVLGAANLRARAAISLMAFSGCRIEVMGDGRDGLRIADIPDLQLAFDADGKQDVKWLNVPARIVVRAALSKTGKPFFTFLGGEGVQTVEAYLRARIERKERLTSQSVVIGMVKVNGYHKALKTNYEGGEQAITSANISDAIRAPMRQAGINERPYIWRSYFAATADRCRDLPSEWREFFEGHVSGVAKTYTLNKGLPPEKIEEMRLSYAKALPLLQTDQPEALNRVAELEKKLAELVSVKPEVRTIADLRERSDLAAELVIAQTNAMSKGELEARTEAQQLNETAHVLSEQVEQLKAELATAIDVIAKREFADQDLPNGKATQRIIPKSALAAALAAGARIVTNAGDGEFVVEG